MSFLLDTDSLFNAMLYKKNVSGDMATTIRLYAAFIKNRSSFKLIAVIKYALMIEANVADDMFIVINNNILLAVGL